MKINRENCEAWFLDYYEGTLSKEREEEMRAFLVMNPDLQEVFDSFENVSFDADQHVKFEGKDSLKKEVPQVSGISESNYNAWIVSLLEGTLNEKEEKMVTAFMATHPKVQREYELLKKTILKPESDISFEKKSSLKKSTPITSENFMELAVMAMDGELDEVTMLSFFDYIASHEKGKEQYQQLLKTRLVADESVVFENKNSLKRTPVVISAENFNEYAVLAMDGELDKATALSFFDFIAQHKEFAKEFEALKRTRLVADATVVFPDKEALKKRDRGGIIWWRFTSYAAAAVVVLFFGIYLLNRTDVNPLGDNGHGIAGLNPDTNHTNSVVIVPNHVVDSANNSVKNNPLLADANTTSMHNHIHQSNTTNISNTTNTSNVSNIAFEPLPLKNINKLNEHIYTNADLSDSYYSTLGSQPAVVASNSETPSFGQYAMRWMKNKLDMRGGKTSNDDQDNDNGDVLAMNDPNHTSNVSGFDLTASAIDRLAYATNSNLHLERNSGGTVLTAFGYDVVLSHNN